MQVVGSAETVKQGIEELTHKTPDLLFLDVALHHQKGFDILNTVYQPELMIVMCTAHAEYAIDAIPFRVMDYLLKPVAI